MLTIALILYAYITGISKGLTSSNTLLKQNRFLLENRDVRNLICGLNHMLNHIYQSSKSYHHNRGIGRVPCQDQVVCHLVLFEVAATTHVSARTHSRVAWVRRGWSRRREAIRQEWSARQFDGEFVGWARHRRSAISRGIFLICIDTDRRRSNTRGGITRVAIIVRGHQNSCGANEELKQEFVSMDRVYIVELDRFLRLQ